MSQYKEETSPENGTLVVFGGSCALRPLVSFDVLEDEVDIKTPLKLHFELFLHFTDNTD